MASTAPSTGSVKLDAVVEKAKANAPSTDSSFGLYGKFALAGAVCCSVTHGGLTPVDVYVSNRSLCSWRISWPNRCHGRGVGNSLARPPWKQLTTNPIAPNVKIDDSTRG